MEEAQPDGAAWCVAWCMSYFHFSRTFKRVAGESFNDFVQQARVRKAGELLAHPNATITHVCFEVGFKEVSYLLACIPAGRRRVAYRVPQEAHRTPAHVPGPRTALTRHREPR